ncbi:hypothetical protein B6N60_00528 [Richelia sinica FACHB-800]|uniref:DUF1468 domain-containing protein n=1 Tax=Richelia sinica FACHB-800 TaxID=1357546 RepID=A0A975T4B9_9NOST|nr:tripartite tricarboxylate transporter TctB family protein [Richelia sinica]MBD2663000.1 tripartite tricarboxylate transporter TctB family protein [Richelia sinica FACHB-800]QXE21850.1 hypothetical protein B6N60_00528 [Richelia sinica FACHB-800]
MKEIHPRQIKRGLKELRLVAVAVILLGIFTVEQTRKIPAVQGFVVVSPQVFPTIVSVGLLLLGIFLFIRTTIKPDENLGKQIVQTGETDWLTVILIIIVLSLYPWVFSSLGYIIGTSLFFPVVARILGSTKTQTDFIAGGILSIIIYFGFTHFLGVRLPSGILDFIL